MSRRGKDRGKDRGNDRDKDRGNDRGKDRGNDRDKNSFKIQKSTKATSCYAAE